MVKNIKDAVASAKAKPKMDFRGAKFNTKKVNFSNTVGKLKKKYPTGKSRMPTKVRPQETQSQVNRLKKMGVPTYGENAL